MSLKMMIVVNLRKSPRLRAYFGSGIGVTLYPTFLFRKNEINNEHDKYLCMFFFLSALHNHNNLIFSMAL